MFNKGVSMQDIEFINTVAPTVTYADDSQQQFEALWELEEGEDIGGLVVYTREGRVRAVYDYEQFMGWVV
jgi:hypothetical protein